MEQLKVTYQREMNHNYMILCTPELQADSYVGKMLSDNNIEGLLKFRQKHTEEGAVYYYEITSKQPLRRLLEGRLITYDEIRALLLSTAGMLRRTEEYLLKEEQILLEPEYIYVEPEEFSVFFCLLPGYSHSFPDAFTKLLQYVLDKVNHQDHRSVVLAYGLYHESLKENYGMEDLLKYLSGVEGEKNRWENTKSLQCEDREKDRNNWETAENGENMEEEKADRCSGFVQVTQREQYSRSRTKERKENQEEYTDTGREKQEKKWKNNKEAVVDNVSEEKEETEERERKDGFFHPFRLVFTILVLEGFIYLFKGMPGLRSYGILPCVIVTLVFLVGRIGLVPKHLSEAERQKKFKTDQREKKRWLQRERTESERAGRNHSGKGYAEREQKQREKIGSARVAGKEEDEWKILFQSLDEGIPDAEICGKKEAETEKDTQLLNNSLSASEGHHACLESSSKDREDIEIPYVPFLIGKHSEMNDFVLSYPTVSRLHLKVDKKERVYIFTDMNSTNGTVVNGYKMEANETVSVKEGDIIQIAGLSYRFREN